MWCSSDGFSKIWIHVQVMQHPHILKLQNMFRINYVCIYIKDCPKQVKLFKYFWVLCQLCILSRNIIKSFHDLVKTWFIQFLGGISSSFSFIAHPSVTWYFVLFLFQSLMGFFPLQLHVYADNFTSKEVFKDIMSGCVLVQMIDMRLRSELKSRSANIS